MYDPEVTAGEPSDGSMVFDGETLAEVDVSRAGCSECRRLEVERNSLRNEAGYWRAQHRKAVEREQVLRAENDALKAKLRRREQQLFGRKTERGSTTGRGRTPPTRGNDGESRRRGQQPGAAGHGRRRHEHLALEVDERGIDEEDRHCPCCNLPLVPEGGAETSEVVEVEVRAHRRLIRRRRYRRTCECEGPPRIITAPPEPKLFPKGAYAISFWVHVLLDKFLFQQPTHRLLTALRIASGLDVSQGTVTDGLKRLMPLFEGLYAGILAHNAAGDHWHADETRWFVFVDEDGEQRYRKWYLWVFHGATSVAYRLDPTRSARVPLEHFGRETCGILSVDRYSAYKVLLDDRMMVLAFCWAHVRRDFVGVAHDWPQHEEWALGWVDDIGELYRHNAQRLAVLDDDEARPAAQARLTEAVERMEKRRDAELAEPKLHTVCRKVLESLERHWSGLVLFVEHPEVPMDNNQAERDLRNPVVGRRGYHGSGAEWSGRLAAMLFSLFQTLLLWDQNPRLWLTAYLEACARHGGQPLPDAAKFLPWNLPEQELRRFQSTPTTAPKKNDTS